MTTLEKRYFLLVQLNNEVRDLGEEDLWSWWITEGIPDEANECDLADIAENTEIYHSVVRTYNAIMTEAARQGLI